MGVQNFALLLFFSLDKEHLFVYNIYIIIQMFEKRKAEAIALGDILGTKIEQMFSEELWRELYFTVI